MKPIIVSGLCLIVAGCNLPSRDSAFLGRADVTSSIQTIPIGQPDAAGPGGAILMLAPEAGGVLRVRERHFRNGTRQDVVMAGGTSGENVLEVSVRTSGGDNAPRGELQIGRPSQRGIAIETAARFPGMRLHVVTRPMSNSYGPFGLAVGRRADGERCVFAWQWIDDINSASGRSGGFASLMGGGAPASVRLRMCRSNMTLDEMAGFMEALAPASRSEVDRIVRLDRRMIGSGGVLEGQEAVAGAGAGLITPMGGTLESALPPLPAVTKVGATPKPAAASKPKAAAQKSAARKAARKPDRRKGAKAPPARPRVERAVLPVEPTPAQQYFSGVPAGPRYLAPVSGPSPIVTGSASPGGFVARTLDPTLPSHAYLGPSPPASQR